MRTSCKAQMKFVDVSALADATLFTNDNRSVGDLGLFQTEVPQANYGTFESNQFILDGSKEIMPDAPQDIAFWSTENSGNDCGFVENPVLEIEFSDMHSSAGLTLCFAEMPPAEIRITWYTSGGTTIASSTFYPDSDVYVCKQQVTNYRKITIEFVKMPLPGRYVKLQYILYGIVLSWEGTEIKSAKVCEEIDVTSETLSINTADISILDADNDFDVGNENGTWKSVQKKQEITLTETVDGKEIPCGTFFMDAWSFKDNIASFSLKDLIGVMDGYQFESGAVYKNVRAGNIFDEIFAACGIEKYAVAEEVAEVALSGYLAVQTCRTALQMICFACGAMADCSRSDTIRIYKPDRYVKTTVGTNRKFRGNTSVTLNEYVSGVKIVCNQYNLDAAPSEIYNGTLSAGDRKIVFSEPYQPESVIVTGGQIKEVKTNYTIISVPNTGTCVVTGKKYSKTEFSYQKDVEQLEAGEVENVKKLGPCTLYSEETLDDLAEYLLGYYSLRKNVSMKYLLGSEQVGNWCNIRDVSGKCSATQIKKQTIDLTGGFIATAECVGYSKLTSDPVFAGEIYAGAETII